MKKIDGDLNLKKTKQRWKTSEYSQIQTINKNLLQS